jgi:hypothetical protein
VDTASHMLCFLPYFPMSESTYEYIDISNRCSAQIWTLPDLGGGLTIRHLCTSMLELPVFSLMSIFVRLCSLLFNAHNWLVMHSHIMYISIHSLAPSLRPRPSDFQDSLALGITQTRTVWPSTVCDRSAYSPTTDRETIERGRHTGLTCLYIPISF